MAPAEITTSLSLKHLKQLARTRIGVIGGGQLSLMLAEAAQSMHVRTFDILDPTPNCPAHDLSTRHYVGAFDDAALINSLGMDSDVVTIEIELAGEEPLRELQDLGIQVHPSPDVLGTIKDKLVQKHFLSDQGIPVAPFRPVTSAQDVADAMSEFGTAVIVKSRRGGYDGRGNRVVAESGQIDEALSQLGESDLYLEQIVPFTKELAVMVARNTEGEIAAYSTVETRHVRNICDVVLAPADIPKSVAESARALALKTVHRLRGVGIFGVEMFCLPDGEVLINELAPRPHNSGHYTIEACAVSQFGQHIRAITGLPLDGVEMLAPAAVTINILGERSGPALLQRSMFEIEPGAVAHIYGKTETAIDRKMGHITLTGDSTPDLLSKARALRATIEI
jgi:5-(carboxyamino)imidazole ribonucleotide synthase